MSGRLCFSNFNLVRDFNILRHVTQRRSLHQKRPRDYGEYWKPLAFGLGTTAATFALLNKHDWNSQQQNSTVSWFFLPIVGVFYNGRCHLYIKAGLTGAALSLGITMLQHTRSTSPSTVASPPQDKPVSTSPSALRQKIGGDFSLVDAEGMPWTNKDLLGRWLIVYFGFCHCPDICPEQLERVMEVMDKLGSKELGAPVQPLFITVDPDRDYGEALRDFVEDYSRHNLLGLTGTGPQINQAAALYRVYHKKGPVDEEGDYVVDHSMMMYLMDPSGQNVDIFPPSFDIPTIVTRVEKAAEKYAASS